MSTARLAIDPIPGAAHGYALWRAMLRIRRVEEAIARHYPQQAMRCPVHLSIGQEAAAVGVGLALTHADQAVSTHRAHAHYLAKGGNLRALIAELYGKAGGCSGGRGGSMHLTDRAAGFLASTAIVGNSIPVGVGAALGLQLAGKAAVACVFLGDGALEEGAFYESANFAVVRRLPVLFVCENNLYSVYSSLAARQPAGRAPVDLARAIGLTAARGDGNDAEAVATLARTLLADVRAGHGPAFMELATYRWLEHCGPFDDDALGYRPAGELQAWQALDPLAAQARRAGVDAQAQALAESEVGAEIASAFDAAAAAPFPTPCFGPNVQYASGPWSAP